MVRNMRAVLKKASWGTRRIQGHSVRRTGFCGTEGIFGTGNALLWYGVHLQSAVPSLFRLTRMLP